MLLFKRHLLLYRIPLFFSVIHLKSWKLSPRLQLIFPLYFNKTILGFCKSQFFMNGINVQFPDRKDNGINMPLMFCNLSEIEIQSLEISESLKTADSNT